MDDFDYMYQPSINKAQIHTSASENSCLNLAVSYSSQDYDALEKSLVHHSVGAVYVKGWWVHLL